MQADSTFPETLQEAIRFFGDEQNSFDFMVGMRWPDGVIRCPDCAESNVAFLFSRKLWKCRGCKRQFSVKVGTVMEDSPIKLDKWLCAFWLIANAKNGISSYEIHRALGVTQKTGWFLLHRIRLALQNGTLEKMSGTVEADETFIGGLAKNMHVDVRERKIKGRGTTGKAIVAGVLQRANGKQTKVRTKVVRNTDKSSLQEHIRANVEPGSNVYTDTHGGYVGLSPEYIHAAVDHAIEYVNGKVSTNGLENFWCLLKRTLKGTYVAVNAQHLFRYLDEQGFRYNERKDNDQGRFLKAVAGIIGKRLMYATLISKEGSLPSAA